MSLISQPSISFHRVEIHTYEQYAKSCEIRFLSVSTLLADTLLGWIGNRLEKPVSSKRLLRELRVTEANHNLFIALLRILQKAGYVKEVDGRLVKEDFDEAGLRKQADLLWKQGVASYGKGQWLEDAIGPSYDLAQACIPRLPELLRGEINSIQLLFSAENYERSTAIYAANLQEVYYGLIAKEVVEKCQQIWATEPERQVRIVEVGAGSGKGSIRLLEYLRQYGDKIHFCFTDIGNSFLRRAKKTFRDFECELAFERLDITENPTDQGFTAASFDIAFASNVVHATPDLRITLANMYGLLRPGGKILINEIAEDMAINTVTYGTTPGWWLPTDGLRMPYSPVASTSTFRKLLSDIGFSEVAVTGYPGVPEAELAQAIIHGVKK